MTNLEKFPPGGFLVSRSVQPTNYQRDPMPLSQVLAETFRHTGEPADLTAWVDGQEIPGQGVLFCDEVNAEFTSTARPGADWGMPCG